MSTPEPTVFSVEQAAELLACSTDTVRDRAPELGGLKFGRDWVFPAGMFFAALNLMAARSMASRDAAPAPSAVVTKLPRRGPPVLP